MAGSKMLMGWLALGLVGACIFLASGDSSAHPRANFKGTRYERRTGETQALASHVVSEVDYVDGPLAPLYDFLIQRRLQRFCKLLRDAKLEEVIKDIGGSWTLFAPNDASFIFLPGGTLEELQRNPQLLRDFILYHFVVGDFPSTQIQNEMLVDSVQGSALRFNVYGQIVTVSGAQILEPDLEFEMGRVYIIDRPLYPIPSMDIITYLQRNYKEIYRLVVDLGLVDYLSSGTYTFLVPDDEAFGYLSIELKDALKTNISLAERILFNHILPGSVYVGGIRDGMQWETVGGSLITFTVKRGLTFANDIPIVLPDVPLTNGVIHVINRVLLPEGVDADCHCKPSSDTAVKPNQVSGGSRPSFGQPQRSQGVQGPTTRRPTGGRQTPRPIGGQAQGPSGTPTQPGQNPQDRPQGPVSPGQTGSRPWSPSRTGQPVRPTPRPGQPTRSPYVPQPTQPPSDDDINAVIGAGVQPDTGIRKPDQTTRYPPLSPPAQRPSSQHTGPQQPQGPQPQNCRRRGDRVTAFNQNLPVCSESPDSPGPSGDSHLGQEVTPGGHQTTGQTSGWSNRQRTPTPRYPTPQRGAYGGPTTRRPQTTRIYDWNQSRVTQPSVEQPNEGAGGDLPAPNQGQDSQTQRPGTQTTSWQQRNQIGQTTRQPYQPPRQPPQPPQRPSYGQTTSSPQVPSNEQTFESRRQQPNCRRQGDRVTPFNQNLPICSEFAPEGCQNSPLDPSDPRPLCPDSNPQDCRSPSDPHDPSDNRPLCPSPVSPTDCREFGQPTYNGDRRPLCASSTVPQTGCKDPSAPYNPSDRRPVCRTTSIEVTPSQTDQGIDSPQGCRRSDEVANPQDQRPLCPEEPKEDCRPFLERPQPGDRRPICKVNRQPSGPKPTKDSDKTQKKPTETTQRQSWQSTTRAPQSWQSTTRAPQSWQSTTRTPQSWQSTTRASQSWQSTTRTPQSWQTTRSPQSGQGTTRAPQSWQGTTRSPQSWQTTRQQGGKQPQPGSNQIPSRPEDNSFQTHPQTGSQQSGTYPSSPQIGKVPSQTQPETDPSKPQSDVQPDVGADLQPQTGQYPSQPQSGRYPSQPQTGRYPTQPQSGRYPSQPGSGRYPSQPGSGTHPSQPGSGTHPSQPGSGAHPSQPGSGTHPSQPGFGAQPSQPGSGTHPSQPGFGAQPSQPGSGTHPSQPGFGAQPSQPGSGTHPSQPGFGAQPSQPGSGTHPSQPGSGTQPSQPGFGTHPSQPGSGTHPSQPGFGTHPSQPGSGTHPSQPQTGSYPPQPQTPSQPGHPQSGSYPTPPQTGSYPSQQPGRPQSGSYPTQPQTGSYPSQQPGRPQSGSYPSQPQTDSHQSQRPGSPHSGSYPSQPQTGSYPPQRPGSPQTGSYPSQPQTGVQPGSQTGSPNVPRPVPVRGQPQTGRPAPGYPQRRPGSQTDAPAITTSQPQYPGVGGTFQQRGSPGTPAPRRPTTGTTRVPISVTGTSTPGEDSRRTLFEIVEDPALLIRGRPVHLTRIFTLFQKAGIQDILNEPGPTTVFLPSDDAFALLPQGVVEQLEENPELLRQVLLYHVTKSEILPSAQGESYTVPSVEGNRLVITMLNGGRLIFISGAKAVAVTRANNGIFYVINQLLYPLPHHDIVGAIQSRPDLSTLAFLLPLSGLEGMLRGQTPYTFLAPTDNAFAQLPQPVYDELTKNTTALQEILLNHIIEGAHYGREFFTGGTFPSARGGKLKFQVVSYGYQVNDVNIKTPEIVTGSGVIHLVDQILLEEPDLKFFTSIENAVAGEDGSVSGPQQPSVGQQQPGVPSPTPVRPRPGLDTRFPLSPQTGTGQPQVGGLQPPPGQQTVVGRVPVSGQRTHGSQPTSPSQPQRPVSGGAPRQPGTGHQTPGGQSPGSTTFGGPYQPSVQGHGQQTHGQTGHSTLGGQRVTTHGQRTHITTFVNQRQPSVQTGGQTSSVGYQGGSFQTGGQATDVADLARTMGLNQFANWITNTGLLEKIHDGGVYTVFAPTDEAVDSLPQEMSYSIQSNPEQVKSILQYHIVPQRLNLNSITNEETASTLLQGKTIRFNVYQNSQPDCKQLVTASGTPLGEALATMGSIQVIPVTQVLYQPSGNLMKIIEASPILQQLNEAVKSARLSWMLTGNGPMTIFAPSDTAFQSLTEEQRKTMIEDKQAFTDLLKRHIVRGTFFSSGIQDDVDKKSDNNKPMKLSLQEGILTINSVPVTYSDITATNGVLHVIDHFL